MLPRRETALLYLSHCLLSHVLNLKIGQGDRKQETGGMSFENTSLENKYICPETDPLPRAKDRATPTVLFFYLSIIYLSIYLSIYLWLRWVFIAARRLSLLAVSGGYSSLRCAGFSLWWIFLLQSTGSRRTGFSSCGTQAQ